MGNKLICGDVGTRCVANCARITVNNDNEGEDDDMTVEPAGTIFRETLERLNYLDQQLLLFCSGHNVEVVRWLLLLGANIHAIDTNSTSALHTACRSGTLGVVQELVHGGLPMDVVDSSGWTPLHIATFMGRKHVVRFLLAEGANLQKLNHKGMTPSDLCNDAYTREVLVQFSSGNHVIVTTSGRGEQGGWSMEDIGREALPGLRYEPFFVPRHPVVKSNGTKTDMLLIGIDLFNRKPGQGLAFLVTTGCVRDYPVDMSSFLRRNKVKTEQVGNFLGESYSLSQILRLEFINSVRLVGLGIVSSLTKACENIRLPADLQKIDRLLHGIARIWWRQHEQEGKPDAEIKRASESNKENVFKEVRGLELKEYFSSPDSLHQLMYGVLLLHWSMYDSDMQISKSQWISINHGLEGDENTVPIRLLENVYDTVKQQRIPNLVIENPKKMGQNHDRDMTPRAESAIEKFAAQQGYVTLMLNANNQPLNNTDSASLQHLASVLTEVADVFEEAHGLPSARRQQGRIYLMMTQDLLFFSSKKDEDPFAFLPMSNAIVTRMSSVLCNISPPTTPMDEESSDGSDALPQTALHFVFLLPDGRWQTYDLNRFEIRTDDEQSMDAWMQVLSEDD